MCVCVLLCGIMCVIVINNENNNNSNENNINNINEILMKMIMK